MKAVEALGHLFGQEMVRKGSDILLGPGLNIHRDPLCGRNFEYYSEDPLLSGTVAGMAAMLDGMVQRIEAELGSPATLILTGGAARFVEPLVFHPHIYDPNLLLKGLAFLYERNCGK